MPMQTGVSYHLLCTIEYNEKPTPSADPEMNTVDLLDDVFKATIGSTQ